MRISLLAALLFAVGLLTVSTECGADQSSLLSWGVDDAGSKGRLLTHPKGRQIMEEFGFNFLVTHHLPLRTVEENRRYIRAIARASAVLLIPRHQAARGDYTAARFILGAN